MLRRLLIALCVLLLLLFGGIWALKQTAANALSASLTEAAREKGLSLQARSAELGLSGFSLQGLSVQGLIGRLPASLELEEARCLPQLASLAKGMLGASFQARLYHGQFNASFEAAPRSQQLSGEARLDRMELAEHALIRSLGIDRGQLSIQVPFLKLEGNRANMQFAFELLKVRKAIETKWSWGLPAPITIPAFDKLSLSGQGSLVAQNLLIKEVQLDSDFGVASAKGSLEPGRFVEISGEASLTPRGTELIGPWLPILSQGKLQPDASHFEVKISGSPEHPQIRMTPL